MEHSVCFIGHRKINNTPELKEKTKNTIVELAENGYVNFLFGDHSAFNSMCYDTVTKLKEKYSGINRICFRSNYEFADEYTMSFLLVGFEESICPKGVGNAGIASYVERNYTMIDESDLCVFYYDKNYLPPRRKYGKRFISDYQPKSGTSLAYAYAVKKKKTIINLYGGI